MNDSRFPPSHLRTLVAFALLLPGLPAVAQEAAPATPLPVTATPPTVGIEELREQLVASLRADLLALREGKEGASTAVMQLAQAIEALATAAASREAIGASMDWAELRNQQAYGRQASSWQTTVQAHGSEQSMKLGILLGQRLQREKAEQSAKRVGEVEALGQSVAQRIFAAKSAAELDPLIQETSAYSERDQILQAGIPAALVMKMQQLHQFLTAWQNHLSLREGGDSVEALRALRRLRSEQRGIPWIPRSELAKQTEAAERLSGLPDAEELSREMKRMGEQALAADKGEAIDPLLVEARRLRMMLQTAEQGTRLNEIQQLVSFLEQWQKALIMRAAGDRTGLKDLMRQLESYGTKELDIPRSKILQRLYALEAAKVDGVQAKGGPSKPGSAPMKLEPPEVVMARIKRLEDLEGNLEALSAAVELTGPAANERSKWQQTIQELKNLQRQYGELQRGLATRVNLSINSSGVSDPVVLDLQQQLSLLSLDRLLGEEAKMPPAPGENAVTYLRRLLAAARDRKDWRLAQRIMETAQSTRVEDPLLKSTDTAALTAFITAGTQERARQFAFAAASYLAALKSGSEWVPVEEIGDRLAAIEKEHPADYQQGVEWARTPPLPNYPPGYYPPGYRPGYPGMDRGYPRETSRPTGEQPVLIPEKKAEPTPKPAESKPALQPTPGPAGKPAAGSESKPPAAPAAAKAP